MEMRLPRPRHGDPVRTTADLRDLAAAVLSEDVRTLARTTAYLRRSYRTVFIGYVAMLVFGVAAVVAAFVKGLTADNVGEAVAAVGLAGLTVGIFAAFRTHTNHRQASSLSVSDPESEPKVNHLAAGIEILRSLAAPISISQTTHGSQTAVTKNCAYVAFASWLRWSSSASGRDASFASPTIR